MPLFHYQFIKEATVDLGCSIFFLSKTVRAMFILSGTLGTEMFAQLDGLFMREGGEPLPIAFHYLILMI